MLGTSVRKGIVLLGALSIFFYALAQSYAQDEDSSSVFLPLIRNGREEQSGGAAIGVDADGQIFGLIGTLGFSRN